MEPIILGLGWVGVFAPLALGAVGSIIGCARAGQAACGAILETEGGYGRYIGVSAMPSSQVIYGIVVMLSLNRLFSLATAPGLFAIGFLVGLALMLGAVYQGYCCASAIIVAKTKSEAFGISLAPAAIVFAFVFALVLARSLPGGGG